MAGGQKAGRNAGSGRREEAETEWHGMAWIKGKARQGKKKKE